MGEGDGGGATAARPRLVELRLAAVEPNPDQPRARIAPEALEALAASVRASGVLQPVVVRPADSRGIHLLVAGERRWRAAALAGLEQIPAIVRPVDPRESVELALVENLVREDLSPIDIAQALACLVEDFGQSHTDLAERLGRSRPAISNLMRLLELPDGVQEMVADGRLSEGHGRAILMADGAARRGRVAEQAVAGGLSVRATERLARAAAVSDAAPPPRELPVLGDRALEVFGATFDTPVRVRPRRGGGMVVELRFDTHESLRRALSRLDHPDGSPDGA